MRNGQLRYERKYSEMANFHWATTTKTKNAQTAERTSIKLKHDAKSLICAARMGLLLLNGKSKRQLMSIK